MRRSAGLAATMTLILGNWLGTAVSANADHFNVAIFGPGLVQPSVWQCTWEAAPYGGVEPLTYEWFRNGELVGTDPWYSGAPANMTLSLHVTDAIGDTGLGIKNISDSQWGGSWCE